MMNRTSKYHGEQGPEHAGKLQWPGVNGFPFRGEQIPNIRQDELEKLPVVGDAREETFDLSKEDEATRYRWVRDRCRNGLFVQDYAHKEHAMVDGKLTTLIYLEWTQLYVQVPPGHSSIGSKGNGSSKTSFTIGGPD
jgi:hypothetical protein